jgi:hypothetical protein
VAQSFSVWLLQGSVAGNLRPPAAIKLWDNPRDLIRGRRNPGRATRWSESRPHRVGAVSVCHALKKTSHLPESLGWRTGPR